METSGSKAQRCPRCGALNGAGFDRCIRCAAPLGALGAGAEAIKAGAGATLDPQQLWGTKVLIGLTALAFSAQLVTLLKGGAPLTSLIWFSKVPQSHLFRFGAMPLSAEAALEEPFRAMSAVFVHFGVLHFAMNMMGLTAAGRVAEPAIGSARFVAAYLACGVLGFAANIGMDLLVPAMGYGGGITAGASGAVFGAMGLTLGWLLRKRDRRWRSYAIEMAFYAIIVNFLVRGVNNTAHVAGLLSGAAFGFYFAWRPRPKSHLPANIGAVVGLVLAVASLVLAQRAAGWGRPPERSEACPSVPARDLRPNDSLHGADV